MDTKFTLISGTGLKNLPKEVDSRLVCYMPMLWPDVESLRFNPAYQLIRLSERARLLPYGMRDVPRLKGRGRRSGLTLFGLEWEIVTGIPRDQEVQKALGLFLMDYCDNVCIKQDITETDPAYHPDMESIVVTYTKENKQELLNIVCCSLLDNPIISSNLTTEQLEKFEGMIL